MTKLREKRLQVGIGSGQLADMVRVSRPFMCDLEKGSRGARIDTWERIAAALKCNLEDVVEDEQMERFATKGGCDGGDKSAPEE